MELVETGWGGVDSIGLAQDREKWTVVMNLLLHLALQPWVSLGLLDNQSSVEFGRWESTAVRYSSLL
jgi:hypothetical protein